MRSIYGFNKEILISLSYIIIISVIIRIFLIKKTKHPFFYAIGLLILGLIAQNLIYLKHFFVGVLIYLMFSFLSVLFIKKHCHYDQLREQITGAKKSYALILTISIFLLISYFRYFDGVLYFNGAGSDEWENGMRAIAILETFKNFRENYLPPYKILSQEMQTLLIGEIFYRYLFALSVKLFGSTIFALRIVPVVLALTSLILLFLLMRHLFNWELALITMFLMGFSMWLSEHKWGVRLTSAPFLAVLSFYFLARGLTKKKWLDFFLFGVLLLFGLETYPSFRPMPFFLLLFFPLAFLLVKGFFKKYWWGAICAYLGAIALFLTYFQHFPGRNYNYKTFLRNYYASGYILSDPRSPEGFQTLKRNLTKVLISWNYIQDCTFFLTRKNEPLISHVLSVSFIFGLIFFLMNIRQKEALLFLLWLGLSPLVAILHDSQSRRFNCALPVTFIICAILPYLMIKSLTAEIKNKRATAFTLFLFFLLAPLAYQNMSMVINRAGKWCVERIQFALEVKRRLAKEKVYISCDYGLDGDWVPELRYLTYDLTKDMYYFRQKPLIELLPITELPDKNITIVAYHTHITRENLKYINELYPMAKIKEHKSLENNNPAYYTISIPKSDIDDHLGLKYQVFGDENLTNLIKDGVIYDLNITDNFFLPKNQSGTLAVLEGFLYIPYPNIYTFKNNTNSKTKLFIYDQLITETDEDGKIMGVKLVYLAQGLNPIKIIIWLKENLYFNLRWSCRPIHFEVKEMKFPPVFRPYFFTLEIDDQPIPNTHLFTFSFKKNPIIAVRTAETYGKFHLQNTISLKDFCSSPARMSIDPKDNLYIYDEMEKAIFIFNQNGENKGRITNSPVGDEGYLWAYNPFFAVGEEEIYIPEMSLFKILIYQKNGEFKGIIDLKDKRAEHLSFFNDRLWILCSFMEKWGVIYHKPSSGFLSDFKPLSREYNFLDKILGLKDGFGILSHTRTGFEIYDLNATLTSQVNFVPWKSTDPISLAYSSNFGYLVASVEKIQAYNREGDLLFNISISEPSILFDTPLPLLILDINFNSRDEALFLDKASKAIQIFDFR